MLTMVPFTVQERLNSLPTTSICHHAISCYFCKVKFNRFFLRLVHLFLCIANACKFCLFLSLMKICFKHDLVMMALASSLFMKGAWFHRIFLFLSGACLFITLQNFSAKVLYAISGQSSDTAKVL